MIVEIAAVVLTIRQGRGKVKQITSYFSLNLFSIILRKNIFDFDRMKAIKDTKDTSFIEHFDVTPTKNYCYCFLDVHFPF